MAPDSLFRLLYTTMRKTLRESLCIPRLVGCLACGRDQKGVHNRMKLLIQFLQVLHWIIVGTVLTGWALLEGPWLVFYLAFLPAMVVQWRLNQDTCIINNFESWLTTGSWRSEENPEEGACARKTIERILGIKLPEQTFNVFIYLLMAVLWGVAMMRWTS